MKKSIDFNVEALRGFCALMVVIHHCIEFSHKLDPGFEFREQVFSYKPSGHLMVLIFFMLSGYVIGIASLNKSEFIVSNYLKRRLIRLYPIYIIAVLLTILLFAEKWPSVLGTLFFTQNLFSSVIEHNNALWSLNHEVIYYLLVIPILAYRIKPSIAFSILIFLLGMSLIKLQFPMIIEGYLVGFLFWLTGFAISKLKLNQQNSHDINTDKLVSMFLLLLSCEYLNSFQLDRLFSKIHLLHGPSFHFLDWMVNINDFSAFPFCLYAIVTASSINIKWFKLLTFFVYLACWSHLIYLIIDGSFFKVNIFYIPSAFLLLSTVLFFSPIQVFKSKSLLVYAGSISYAMYVIHLPLLELIGKVNFFTGSISSFIVRFFVLCLIVGGASYLLEKIIQPYIKKLFKVEKTEASIIMNPDTVH